MEPQSVVSVKRNPGIAEFAPGDTVRVGMRIKEGDRERVQTFHGVVISVKGRHPATMFTVRRVSFGIGIERTFPLYSPLLEKVEVVRKGDVRRANLYYLRGRFGRHARIKERAWSREDIESVAEAPAVEPEQAEAVPQPATSVQTAQSAPARPESAKPAPTQPAVEQKPSAPARPEQAPGAAQVKAEQPSPAQPKAEQPKQ